MLKNLFIFSLICAAPAMAGGLTIQDQTNRLSTDQIEVIRATAASLPFDVAVLTGDYPNKAALDQAVSQCVVKPLIVCIGIDPGHRATNVHFGTGTGIPSNSFSTISSAGNMYFKLGDFGAGIAAIANTAGAYANVQVAAPVPARVTYEQPAPVRVQQQLPSPDIQREMPLPPVFTPRVETVPTSPVQVSTAPTSTTIAPTPAPAQSDSGGSGFLIVLFTFAVVVGGGLLFYKLVVNPSLNSSGGGPYKPAYPWGSTSAPASNGTAKVSGSFKASPPIRTKPTTPENISNSGFSDVMLGTMLGSELSRPSTPAVPPTIAPPTPKPSTDAGGNLSSWDAPAPITPPKADLGGSSSGWDEAPKVKSGGASSSWDVPAPPPAPPTTLDSGSSSSSWDSGSSSSGGSSDSGGSDSGW